MDDELMALEMATWPHHMAVRAKALMKVAADAGQVSVGRRSNFCVLAGDNFPLVAIHGCGRAHLVGVVAHLHHSRNALSIDRANKMVTISALLGVEEEEEEDVELVE